ncbi:MAG: hypothetical protein GXO73_13045 [Calditrichaeota bacterium]|nr:hypothetical protein [Calditrichota bacterium]
MSLRLAAGVALVGVAAVGLGAISASAQIPAEGTAPGKIDTLSGDLFELRLARLRLEAISLRDSLEDEDRRYVKALLAEADSAYQAGDLDLASVRLLEAEVVLETFGGQDTTGFAEESLDVDFEPDLPTRSRSFGLEAFAGVDLWKEQFALPEQSRVGAEAEGAGNPFAGLRADFSGSGSLGTLLSYTEARTSRDYTFALVDVDLSGAETGLGRPRLELRLSGTDYRAGEGTDYLQGRLRGRWELKPLSRLVLAPVGEVWDTRYARCTGAFFVSFKESAYGFAASASLPVGIWFDADVRHVARRYDSKAQADFDGVDLWSSIGYSSGTLTSTLWFGYETRDFEPTPSRWSGSASYRDAYADGRLRWLLGRPWGVEFRTFLEKRRYLVPDPATPDFVEAQARLLLVWQPAFSREVSVGPVYRWRTSPAFPGAAWSRWEDYRSWGLAVEVDLLQGDTWSLHLTNTFESRTHPYGPPYPSPGLSLYDDRLISSSLLLASWRFAEGWEVTATVNLDREDDRRQAEGDVQSTLFSLQCARKIF